MTKQEKTLALSLYGQKIPIMKISRDIGFSKTTIIKLLKKEEVFKYSKPNAFKRLYTIDDNFFDKINTTEKAYWLGFIFADGCVTNKNHIVVSLQGKDSQHLEKLALVTKSTYPVTNYSNHGYPATTINICSTHMFQSLAKYNVVPAKSLTCSITEEIINHKFLSHFIRGFFDGDGGFGIKKEGNHRKLRFFFTCNRLVANQIQDILSTHCDIPPVTLNGFKHSPQTVCIHHSGNILLKRFCDFIYKDANIWLDRKKKIAESVLFLS